jgi:autotransporter-associated beta strand protein
MFLRNQKQPMKLVGDHFRFGKKPANSLFRPRLELLEDRCVPSTANYWSSVGGASWNDPSNWSLGHVPTSTEIATFDAHSLIPCTIDAPAVGQDTASGIAIGVQYPGTISLVTNLTLGSDGFTQSGGTFMAGTNNTIMDAGQWFENAFLGFDAGTSTVNFNGANGQLLDAGSSAFYNVIHSGLSQLQLNNDLTVKQYFTNSANTFDANNFNLTVGSLTTITDSSVINSGNSPMESMVLGGGLHIAAGDLESGAGFISLSGGVYAYTDSDGIPVIQGYLGLNGVTQTFNVHPGSLNVDAVVYNGGIIKIGQGTMTLAGNNIYSGMTTVNEGTLQITGNSANSSFTINSGLLEGTGSVGAVTVGSGGGLLAGDFSSNTPGFLYTGNLQVSFGGVLDVIANGSAPGNGYSQLNVFGTVSLGDINGGASFQMLGAWRPHSGDQFRFIVNQGASPIGGNIFGAPEGTIETNPPYGRLSFTYKGGPSGNDFVVTSIPISDIVGRASSSGQWWVGQSTGAAFKTSLGTSWSPAATWVDVQTGDFNGDGHKDLIGRVLQTGQWWVSVSDGVGGFTTSLWDAWNPSVTWVDVKVGDFNSDGKDDIVGRVLQSGQWWVGQSTGNSFTNGLWATWSPAATWSDVKVGDFNGDGKADLVGRTLQGGQWWVGQSLGNSFKTSLWATWNPNVTWVDVNVGDFNGDGHADIVGRAQDSGQWWVGLSDGVTSFTTTLWTAWNPNATWVDVKVGDFNGDGKADLIGRVLQTGQWWVSESNGVGGFTTSLWTTWNPNVTWVDVQVGDFNGDGKDDIVGRLLQSGQWWAGLSNSNSFSNALWSTWSTAETWVDVHADVFS